METVGLMQTSQIEKVVEAKVENMKIGMFQL